MNLLLVDDEAPLLQLLGQHLVRSGHVVEPAGNVSDALAVIAKAPIGAYDIALIDWSLPDGTGLEVAEELLKRDSKARVIFTSGYPLDEQQFPASMRDRVRVLQKPFMPRALGEIMAAWRL